MCKIKSYKKGKKLHKMLFFWGEGRARRALTVSQRPPQDLKVGLRSWGRKIKILIFKLKYIGPQFSNYLVLCMLISID